MDREKTEHHLPPLKGMSKYLRIGKTKILKNPVPESEPTPLGFWREALTNKDTAERVVFGLCSR